MHASGWWHRSNPCEPPDPPSLCASELVWWRGRGRCCVGAAGRVEEGRSIRAGCWAGGIAVTGWASCTCGTGEARAEIARRLRAHTFHVATRSPSSFVRPSRSLQTGDSMQVAVRACPQPRPMPSDLVASASCIGGLDLLRSMHRYGEDGCCLAVGDPVKVIRCQGGSRTSSRCVAKSSGEARLNSRTSFASAIYIAGRVKWMLL